LRQIESERLRAEQCAQQRAHDVVDAPVRNITDQLLNVDDHQDVADYPQEPTVLGVHESESEQPFAARDEEGGVQEEINAEQFDVAVDDELSSDNTQINHHLQSIIQQLRLKEDKINKLEHRIKDIEHWKTTLLSTSWPSSTSEQLRKLGNVLFLPRPF